MLLPDDGFSHCARKTLDGGRGKIEAVEHLYTDLRLMQPAPGPVSFELVDVY